MAEIKIMKVLQQKMDLLESLLGDEKERKKQAKQLEIDIAKLIAKQPGLPRKGDSVWVWYSDICYYTPYLCQGVVEDVVWRRKLKCFKVCVRCGSARLWRTLDRIWKTEKEAKRWDLLREIKAAQANLEAARARLEELNKQLED